MEAPIITDVMYLAASDGKNVKIWDVEPTKETVPPSFRTNISCESSSPIVTYDPRSGEPDCVRQMTWNPRTCKLFCLSHSGKRVHIQRILPRDTERPTEEVHELTKVEVDDEQKYSPSDSVTCFAFPQRVGHYFATGRANGEVMVHAYNKQFVPRSQFNLGTLSDSKYRLDRGKIVPTCITWALQDRLLVLGTERGDLYATPAAAGRKADFQAPRRLAQPGSDTKPSTCVTLKTSRMDSSLVAAGYASGMVAVWQLDWPLSENTALHLSICFSPVPLPRTSLFNESVSIAFPALTTQLLITAGAPDLCARVWHWNKPSVSLSSPHKGPYETAPFHILEPPDNKTGFLVVDLASDSFTLAAGLMHGEVWLYDLRSLSAPRLRLTDFKAPIRHLAFVLSLQSHDEVRFKDSVSIDRSQHPLGLYLASNENTVMPVLQTPIPQEERCALSDITNYSISPPKSSRECRWNEVFHDLSIPELSLHSSETSHSGRGSIQVSFSPSILTQPIISPMSSTDHEPDLVDSDLRELHCTPSVPITVAHTCMSASAKTKQTPIPELSVNRQLDRRIANLEYNLHSQLNANQSELLFYFSQLEHAVQRMRSEYAEALTQLHRENDELRRQLQRRTYFY